MHPRMSSARLHQDCHTAETISVGVSGEYARIAPSRSRKCHARGCESWRTWTTLMRLAQEPPQHVLHGHGLAVISPIAPAAGWKPDRCIVAARPPYVAETCAARAARAPRGARADARTRFRNSRRAANRAGDSHSPRSAIAHCPAGESFGLEERMTDRGMGSDRYSPRENMHVRQRRVQCGAPSRGSIQITSLREPRSDGDTIVVDEG